MLVLTRSCDEEIRIGDEVIVRVLDVKGDRVRIGIQAPPNIAVHRQEVFLEIERANRLAMDVSSSGLNGAKQLTNSIAKGEKLTSLARKVQPSAKVKSNPKYGSKSQERSCTEVNNGT